MDFSIYIILPHYETGNYASCRKKSDYGISKVQ